MKLKADVRGLISIYIVVGTTLAGSQSMAAADDRHSDETFGIWFDDAGCSDDSASAYRDSCHRKLTVAATRHCVESGASEEAIEIPNTFVFDGADGGDCSSTSGRYISYVCEA